MPRIVIDLSRDLPARTTPPTAEELASVFGGECAGRGERCGGGGGLAPARNCCPGLTCVPSGIGLATTSCK